jgi:restriction system protein
MTKKERKQVMTSTTSTNDQTLWGIHAGATGDAHTLFVKHNCVALGWEEMGDLSALPPNREAFKAEYNRVYPNAKPGAIAVNAGQLFRFVHEMQPGDIVLYPSKVDKEIHIGRVTGPYRYDKSIQPSYFHRRDVQWLKQVPRTRLSQGALYEIGSAMTLFQVKNYADEWLAILDDRQPLPPPPDEDETVAAVTEDIIQNTRDFVLKTLSRELKGHPLAEFVAHLLRTMGYHTRVSPPGTDRGIDIIATRDELGFEPPIVKVQVKSSDANTGRPDVQALYGNVENNEHGLFVALGGFTPPATDFARSKSNLRLIDGDALVDLILAHYEEFDSRYKGTLPLKRVYVPEAILGSDG